MRTFMLAAALSASAATVAIAAPATAQQRGL